MTCSGQYTYMESDLYITFLPVPYGSSTVSAEICITGMYTIYNVYIFWYLYYILPVSYDAPTVSPEICIRGMYATCTTLRLDGHRVSPNRVSNKGMVRIYKNTTVLTQI